MPGVDCVSQGRVAGLAEDPRSRSAYLADPRVIDVCEI